LKRHEGDHTIHVPQRIETRVLPFFSNNLSFTLHSNEIAIGRAKSPDVFIS